MTAACSIWPGRFQCLSGLHLMHRRTQLIGCTCQKALMLLACGTQHNAVILQLLHWQKRRDAAQPPGSPRLLRLVPAFKQPPLLLVPRQVRTVKSRLHLRDSCRSVWRAVQIHVIAAMCRSTCKCLGTTGHPLHCGR